MIVCLSDSRKWLQSPANAQYKLCVVLRHEQRGKGAEFDKRSWRLCGVGMKISVGGHRNIASGTRAKATDKYADSMLPRHSPLNLLYQGTTDEEVLLLPHRSS